MFYIDTNTNSVQTTTQLTQRGLPQDDTILRLHGIHKIRHVYPEYNDLLYSLQPDKALQQEADGQYTQNFTVVPLELSLAQHNLKARIAAQRYEVEMGGTQPLGGVDWTDADGSATGTTIRLGTDVDSRTRLQTALDACPEGGTILYKLGGEFRTLSRAELTALRDAVAAHVQMCFNREAELFAAIDAAENVEVLTNIKWSEEQPA